ncbi:MAG TPA: MAPEG family protein [Devosiaceae bacterium]|jgi:hypothetical protein
MTLTAALVLFAILAQGAIALVLLAWLGSVRLPLVSRGKVLVGDIALSRDPWPVEEKRVANAFDNQFQLPVLFYVASGMALYLGAGWVDVLLAWLFVLSRVVHAGIFATVNHVHGRFVAYTVGYAALIIFWIVLTIRIVLLLGHS